MLRSLVKSAVATALHSSGADTAIGALRRPRRRPVVVGYHRVVDDLRPHLDATIPAMLTSRRMLERHLDWIGRHFRVASADELEVLLDRRGEPARPVATITFDDGYRDVYDHAFPLLKRKGMPAIVFVVSDLVGTTRVLLHDRLHVAVARALRSTAGRQVVHGALAAVERSRPRRDPVSGGPLALTLRLLTTLPHADVERFVDAVEAATGVDEAAHAAVHPLTWEMLAEMQRHGVTVGAHTRTHPLLTREAPATVREETAGSRRMLQARLGVPVRHFAYPAGDFDTTTVSAVAAAGYRVAYTACHHRNEDHPRLTLPRTLLWERSSVDAWQRFSPPILRCQLGGVFDLVGACRRTHR
jgi:peptidoglycan/xylan/chitin deacetylase (PgdA/CDA1 family)